MIFSGQYFKDNPQKVIGEIVTHNPNTGRELTDQFGKPRPEVWGTVEDVQNGIDVPKALKYDHFKPNIPSLKVAEAEGHKGTQDRIDQALRKTKEETSDRRQRTKCDTGLKCLEDSIRQYNTKIEYKDDDDNTQYYTISPDEIQVWVTYQATKGLFSREVVQGNAWGQYLVENPNWKQWHDKELVAFDGKEYIPEALFYAGNVYEKIRFVQQNRETIIQEIGEGGYEAQLKKLEAIKPKPLLISDDEKQKLHLSPFDKIWDEIEITALADGQEVDPGYSIGSIFYFYYLKQLPDEDFMVDKKRTNAFQVWKYWIEKDRFPRGTDEQKKAAIKRNTTIVGQHLFNRFLIEALSRDDKNQIAALWNSKRNNYRHIQYHKIPVGFTIGEKFKGGMLKVRPAQREGVAFMNSRGTGIVAYDVGVGKTMTAIIAIADSFEKGLFKRPMIVVPQKVYKKWIAEIRGVYAENDIKKGKKVIHKKGSLISEGILPHVEVVDYDNLGVSFISRAKDENGVTRRVPEFSITMITYEGLGKVGFNPDTEKGLSRRLLEALSQGESGRGRAVVEQRAEEWIDNALKGTELDIEEMGIDAIIVDEAHNFRNIFMEVKGDVGRDGEREQRNFFSSAGSKPSARALSLFMLNAYVQNKHGRRNTFGLTATPFTNRATEIYSMLSLYDYEGMKDFDCYNISQFCTAFIDETMEDAWTAAGKFEPRAVIRGYNNLPTLQSLVFRSINYKTGEDANIQRPEKILLPLSHDENGVPLSFEYIVDTKLKPTRMQAEWMKDITMFASKETSKRRESKIAGYYPEDEKGNVPGQTLIALNASRTVTFSPYSIRLGGEPHYEIQNITPEQFVQGSPKIQYAIECIRSVKQYHEKQGKPISGQVIYSDRGTEWFGHIKAYLVENIGFTDKQVEVFHGGVSKGKRERIKEEFLDGKVKVIIGSSTMREGVDLQKYGSTMYICYIDWNPTDVHQLFGRIWRFGNKFSHVRICVPLIENSSDVFTWQKLSEKMSRLNSIWTRSDGTKLFEESELNAEELKKGLINDPAELANYEIAEAVQSIASELVVVESGLKELREAVLIKERFGRLNTELEELAREAVANPAGLKWDVKPEQVERLKALEITDQKSIYRIVRQYGRLKNYGYSLASKVDDHINYSKRMQRLEDKVLKEYELTVFDNFNPVIEAYEGREASMKERIAQVKSPENLQATIAKYEREKETENANSRTVEQRVAEFQRLNYLLDCEFGIHNCDIYGRIELKATGKKVETASQERPSVEAEYQMSSTLRKFMPRQQQKAIQEWGQAAFDQVIQPLDEQVQAIPAVQKQSNAVVYAHFFYGGTDWFVTAWNKKEGYVTAYTILNQDVQNSELGGVSLKELTTTKGKLGAGIELDFHWTPLYLPEALHNAYPNEFPAPKLTLQQAIDEGIEERVIPGVTRQNTGKPALQPKPIGEKITAAITGLETLSKLKKGDKTLSARISKALKGLRTLQKLKKAA